MVMRIIFACLLLILIGLQYKLWLGDANVFHWMRLEKKLKAQEEENKQLIARNRILEADVLELKSGEQALEEEARFELGMIKDGESYYHVVE